MRSAIFVHPNYFQKILSDEKKLEQTIRLVKEIIRNPFSEYLVYWIDDNSNSLMKEYKNLIILGSQNIQFRYLLEEFTRKIKCENFDNHNFDKFKADSNLTTEEIANFLKNFNYIKLFLANEKENSDFKIEEYHELYKKNFEDLSNFFSDLFQNLEIIRYSDPFIIKHSFNLDEIYNKRENKFKIKKGQQSAYIETLKFCNKILLDNNKNPKIEIFTSYYDKSLDVGKHVRDYFEKNKIVPKIHNDIKNKLIELIGLKNKNTDIKIFYNKGKSKNIEYRFYKRTMGLKYKSGVSLILDFAVGINFLDSDGKPHKKSEKTVELIWNINKIQSLNNIFKYIDEFSTEKDLKDAEFVEFSSV